MANQEKAFLGTGWAFPPGLDDEGKIRLVSLEEDVRQAILIIIQTVLGERVMRPDFGSGLHNLVFEPVNRTTMALVQNTVERALIDWEPRIEINNLEVTTDQSQRNTLEINLLYTVRATNTQFNLVFPFFLLEGGEQGQ
ncbi:MAG: GPW/gp25 family protein [Acidobacteria bacterium]|nr:GPW/gp25 family protein [Acidobacteriota bacterium]